MHSVCVAGMNLMLKTIRSRVMYSYNASGDHVQLVFVLSIDKKLWGPMSRCTIKVWSREDIEATTESVPSAPYLLTCSLWSQKSS